MKGPSGVSSVPRAAALLGGAGLVPPLACLTTAIAVRESGSPLEAATASVLFYAALILSFLGGMWWGLAAGKIPGDKLAPFLAVSVLPALLASAALLLEQTLPHDGALITASLLAFGLLASLVVDKRLVRDGIAPTWWMRLRIPLSVILAAVTLATGWLAS